MNLRQILLQQLHKSFITLKIKKEKTYNPYMLPERCYEENMFI